MKRAITVLAVPVAAAALYLAAGPAGNAPAPAFSPAAPAADHPATPKATPASPAGVPAASGRSEVVLGVRVRKDRQCTVEWNDHVTRQGKMFPAYRCIPDGAGPDHGYAHYGNTTLEVMSYADAEAADVLGRRLLGSDPGKAYAMLVRATALDGDVRRLAWLADQAFSATRIDGKLQVGNVMRRYELAALAAELGDDPALTRFLRSALTEAGIGAEQFATLDGRVDALVETVRQIQRSVFGEVRHGGQNDA